jgi:hypothetical protein
MGPIDEVFELIDVYNRNILLVHLLHRLWTRVISYHQGWSDER